MTTSKVGLKNGLLWKNITKSGEPQRYSLNAEEEEDYSAYFEHVVLFLCVNRGTEEQKEKNLRKAQRMLDEIFTLKVNAHVT